MSRNLCLVDDTILEKDLFIDGVNDLTTAVLFGEYRSIDYTVGVQRIALVFHGSPMVHPFMRECLDEIIGKCGTVLTRIDFLGCATLLHPAWTAYYADLQQQYTTITFGASDDETGNVKAGGNWMMENTGDDIRSTYFSDKVERYHSTLYVNYNKRNGSAFAAVRKDGSVVCAGSPSTGGDCSTVVEKLRRGVAAIYSTGSAFAALKIDGTVVCWGLASNGGN